MRRQLRRLRCRLLGHELEPTSMNVGDTTVLVLWRCTRCPYEVEQLGLAPPPARRAR